MNWQRLYGFLATIHRFHKHVNINNLFVHTARLRNSLPAECFLSTYGLKVKGSFFHLEYLIPFFICFPSLSSPFLITPCLAVAEDIPKIFSPDWSE